MLSCNTQLRVHYVKYCGATTELFHLRYLPTHDHAIYFKRFSILYYSTAFVEKLMPFITTTLLAGVATVLTACSVSSDAKVRLTSAKGNSPLGITVLEKWLRFYQRRVDEFELSIPAADIVVSVKTFVVPEETSI